MLHIVVNVMLGCLAAGAIGLGVWRIIAAPDLDDIDKNWP